MKNKKNYVQKSISNSNPYRSLMPQGINTKIFSTKENVMFINYLKTQRKYMDTFEKPKHAILKFNNEIPIQKLNIS